MGCVVPMVIWSEFGMRQLRDDDHREYAPHFNKYNCISKTVSVVFILKSEDGDLTDRNSEIAASLFNSFLANEDGQFECYGIFHLNKWSDNETHVKNTLRETVKNYSESCQKGFDRP